MPLPNDATPSVAVLSQLAEVASLALLEGFEQVGGDDSLRAVVADLLEQLTAQLAGDFARADRYAEAIATANLEARGYRP